MAIPDSYHWSESADGSCTLYLRYGCVASIAADGTTKVRRWDRSEIVAKAGSVSQARRFVERWINAKNSPRAHEYALWRVKHARRHPILRAPKADDAYRFLKEQVRPATVHRSSQTIKVDNLLPDDFESIADVREPLQAFTPHADFATVRRKRILVMPDVG